MKILSRTWENEIHIDTLSLKSTLVAEWSVALSGAEVPKCRGVEVSQNFSIKRKKISCKIPATPV